MEKSVIFSVRQVRPVIFYPTKFANCYQSRKALFSCFGASQIFVRCEIWWMFQSTSQNIKLRACKCYLLNLPLRLSTSFVPTEEHILWRKIPFKIQSGYFLIKSQFSCWKLINRVCYFLPFSDFLIHCYFPCLILFPMLGQNIFVSFAVLYIHARVLRSFITVIESEIGLIAGAW